MGMTWHFVPWFKVVQYPCKALPINNTDRVKINSAIRFVMVVARSSGHTHEKLWSVLCVLQLLLESFIHLLYSLSCIACKWLIKLDVPPPSASCWVQRRYCTRFTFLPLTFVTVGGSKNSQTGLVHATALFWLSAALLAQLLFFTRASRPAALFPDMKMGLGTRLKNPCDQVFKSGYVLKY